MTSSHLFVYKCGRAMIRILLLASRWGDYQSQRATDALARGLGAGFSVEAATIGRELRDGVAAVRWVRQHRDGADLIHVVGGIDALTTAAMGFGGRILFTPSGEVSAKAVGWTRAVSAYRDVHVAATTSTQHHLFASRGVQPDRVHLIRPGVDFARVRRRRDDALRARLGFSADDYVLLAAGESTRGAAHHIAVWTGSVLNVKDARVRLLLWGKGDRAAAVARFARRMVEPNFISVATERLGPNVQYEDLLPATDCILSTAAGTVATLPIAVSMAAALPIISTVTYTTAELLEDRHNALMVTQPTARFIARRIRDVRADGQLQWAIADTARAEAYEHFPLSRHLDQHRTLYRQLAVGNAVDLPDPHPGLTARALGRA